jgi:hypothetical protein
VEQTNYQELNKKTFSDHIADPAAIDSANTKALESSIEKFPYSQLLRSFYTRSLKDSSSADFEKELSKTALFTPDRNVLQRIINEAENLVSAVSEGVVQENPKTAETMVSGSPLQEDPSSAEAEMEEIKAVELPDNQEITTDDQETLAEETEPEESDEIPEAEIADQSEQVVEEDLQVESEQVAEEENISLQADLNERPEIIHEKEEEAAADLVDDIIAEDPLAEEEATEAVEDELSTLINENLAPADYLKEEDPIEASDPSETIFRPEIETLEGASNTFDPEQKVSRYDDDKLPYSFLWWLNKTRKEHSETYQPYVSFQLDTSQSIRKNTVDQLSSQIIENIFHLQSPIDELENAPRTVPFQVKRKEDHILEKFIKEEPQIKPPNSQKLDTENKARKSAEDPNDLVSETLAQIYTDQMLFHKAIDTYKKLVLKFPEKSTYFADRIRELEKKIN